MRADSGWGGGGRLPSRLSEFTAGHFCVTGKRKLWKQTGVGQKLISAPRLKAHLSRRRSFIEADSQGPPCKWRPDYTRVGWGGGVSSQMLKMRRRRRTLCPTVQLPPDRQGGDRCCLPRLSSEDRGSRVRGPPTSALPAPVVDTVFYEARHPAGTLCFPVACLELDLRTRHLELIQESGETKILELKIKFSLFVNLSLNSSFGERRRRREETLGMPTFVHLPFGESCL